MARYFQAIALILVGFVAFPLAPRASIQTCVGIADDRERLACFDREAAALLPKDSHAPAQIDVPKAQLTPQQQIGLPKSQIQKMVPQDSPPKLKSLDAVIVEISENTGGLSIFKLDNGQTWMQSEAKTLLLHVGDKVVLSSGALGSFWLSAGKHAATRVHRVS